MRKGIVRGLIIGLVSAVVIVLYQWLRYRPDTTLDLYTRISNGVFQFGLIYLMVGVVIFSRLFSFRRRMGLRNYVELMKIKTREEHLENEKVKAELNERDKVVLRERGRDVTLLVAALLLMLVSVVLTFDQVQ
ncbi:hypothetical protein [Tumebacillus permanentifrigoris]|uniref:DUF3899 domain-containing protein n=1 Tax=Tumebacillus permanentifrigoris TaxID=378543 RepID=A0A316DEK4_9BACL|nr:hypothetical protein [Tumebacillus permanentifrigoris]PWK16166.1 hypothetical protein C7459_10127 [Tumebacillus permanentifrigoris]